MDLHDNYGIIGNGQSSALISREGSIDWLCLPHFDSPSVFAKMLDETKGGCFSIRPTGEHTVTQRYIPKTNILSTIFQGSEGSFEIIDFMPRYFDQNGFYHTPPDVIRQVRVLHGEPTIKIFYTPKLNYGENQTTSSIKNDYIKSHTSQGPHESVYLYSSVPLEIIDNNEDYRLTKDEYFLLSYNQKISRLTMDNIELELELTRSYWLSWVSRTTMYEKYNGVIQRSALLLKILSYQKTGAILAAPTTSLPETIGDVRNWDYRYCWIRDASMTIHILNRLGHVRVAKRFLQFILNIIPYKDEKIQIMYDIHGKKDLPERELDWLEGYMKSKPVRVENDAYHQKQNDLYGILMDMLYEYLKLYKNTLHNLEDMWSVIRTLARHVLNNWDSTDQSIWEFRSNPSHYTFSKILC